MSMEVKASETTWQKFKVALRQVNPGIQEASIGKLELTRDGGLLAQLNPGPQSAWVRWDGRNIEAIDPARDSKIPLAGLVRERASDPLLKILNYRPGRRLVVLDSAPPSPCVVKGYRAGKARIAHKRYLVARQACADSGLQAPEILEFCEKTESLVFAVHAGEPPDLGASSKDLFHRLGEGLARFQRYASDFEGETFCGRDELAVIDRFAAKVRELGLELPSGWEAHRAELGKTQRILPAPTLGLCHRDLHDGQLVCNGSELTLLDFDQLCRADVTLDPANFLAHMVLRQFQDTREPNGRGVRRCGRQFLDGFDRFGEKGFWMRLRFYQASSFLRLALVYTLRPRWSALAPRLAHMCGRCLDDLERVCVM